MRSDIPEIRQGLQDRIVEVCERLLPHGRRDGGLYVATNPRVAGDDRKIPALKVRISGGDIGAWMDYRNGRDGERGDVIGLIAYLLATDTRGALVWSRDFLGLRSMSRAERDDMRRAAEQKAIAARRRDADKRRWKLTEADRLFSRPEPGTYGPARCAGTAAIGAGTAAEAHARAYFAGRDCALEEVATLNAMSLRFSPGTEWWKGAKWEMIAGGGRRKVEDGPAWPAVHAGMRNSMGIVTCCHVTFLDPAAPQKAPVEPAKLMFGEKTGTVIELATGPSRTPYWQWFTERGQSPVIICEGIETGLSLAGALGNDARIWAAGDLSNMGHAPVWLDCVSQIYLARDNNAGNAQAQRHLDKVQEELESAGKPLAVMASHVGDDFNDLAQGQD